MSNQELIILQESFDYSEIIEEPKEETMAEEKKEIIKMDDKTKTIVKRIGFGMILVGSICACVAGASAEEVKNGGVIAFAIVDIIGVALAWLFGEK